MKPKRSYAASPTKSNSYDCCQTPPYAVDPLLPFLPRSKNVVIWEPAAGKGYIVRKLESEGFSVLATDIQTGVNFLTDNLEGWDIIVTNPPFSIKYKFLRRCYELGKPFALIMPVESMGVGEAQKLFSVFGVEVIWVNRRIGFEMPKKGFNCTPQFATAWFTWGLRIGRENTFSQMPRYSMDQLPLRLEVSKNA